MPRRNETKIELYEDLFIYQNPNGNFYAYVKTDGGKRIRKSLKTKDEGKARSKAKELYRNITYFFIAACFGYAKTQPIMAGFIPRL